MDRGKAIKVYFVAVVCAVTTGFSFLGAKTALAYGTPLEALFFRFTAGFLFALLVVGIKCRKTGFIKGKALKPLLIPAVLYSAGFFGFQFVGLMYASSIEAGIVMSVQPAITMIVAELTIKEKPTIAQRICVVVAIMAAAFISVYGSAGVESVDIRGIVLIALSALSMAGNVVYIRWIRNDYSPIEVSFVSCAFGFVFYTVAALIAGAIGGSLGRTFSLLKEPSFVIAVLFLGIGCTMLTTLMNSYMMIYLEAIKVSVFGCAGTIITLLAGYFILNEDLSVLQILSSIVILMAIIGTNALGKSKPGKSDKDNKDKVSKDKAGVENEQA